MANETHNASEQPGNEPVPGNGKTRARPPLSWRRSGPELVLALLLFATAGVLIYAKRAEWAAALSYQGLDGHGPGPRPSAIDFDLTNTIIPSEQIQGGGPPKDGIPALTDPTTLSAADARYLDRADRVAGVSIGGESRAYPLRILTWHEVVNDTVGGTPIAVTYCPLCDSVVVFDRRTEEGVKEFGVSGLLYNSNVLIYDRGGAPESLWSQVMAKSVTGDKPGIGLKALPVELTTWAEWSSRHPKTTVLSEETGHFRDYTDEPYADYFAQPGLMFPVQPVDDRMAAKQRVLGVWLPDGTARAYPISAFAQVAEPVEIHDEIGGQKVSVHYDPSSKTLRVTKAPEDLQWMYAFWFAWYAFHPETGVYEPR